MVDFHTGVDDAMLGDPRGSGEYWFSVQRDASRHAPHYHPACALSGTLYLRAPEDAGRLRFQDPRRLGGLAALLREGWDDDLAAVTDEALFDDEVGLAPRAGAVVLFPPWVKHHVEATPSPEPRVSLSFNLAGRWGATLRATADGAAAARAGLAADAPEGPPDFSACKARALAGACVGDPDAMLRACAAVCEIYMLARDVEGGAKLPG